MTKKLYKLIQILPLIFFFSGCKLHKEQKRGFKKGVTENGESNIILTDSITFERTNSFREGNISFKSKLIVTCEVQFWTDWNENNPTIVPCQKKPAKEISQSIGPLEQNKNYTIKVSFWPPDLPKKASKYFIYKEKGELHEALISNLVIAKTVVSLRTTEIFQHQLKEPSTVSGIRDILIPKKECKAEITNKPFPYVSTTEKPTIESISSSGFARGTASPHPHFSNRFIQQYDFLQTNLNWDWNYKWKSIEQRFSSRAPGYLSSLYLKSGDIKKRLKNKSVNYSNSTINIKDASELNFEWYPKNRTTNSYFKVTLKGRQKGYNISCIFSSASGMTSINKELLNKMPTDDYELLAIFSSTQIHTRTNMDIPTWVMVAHDWRYATINWQGKN